MMCKPSPVFVAGHGRHAGKCGPRLPSHEEGAGCDSAAHCLNLLQSAQAAQLQQEVDSAAEAAIRNPFGDGIRTQLIYLPSQLLYNFNSMF